MSEPRPPLWRTIRAAFYAAHDSDTAPPVAFAAVFRAIADEVAPEEAPVAAPWHAHVGQETLKAGGDYGRRAERQRIRQALLSEADRAEAGE